MTDSSMFDHFDSDVVDQLREEGFTWPEIGAKYGISGEAARSKYRRLSGGSKESLPTSIPVGAELTHIRVSEYDREAGVGVRQSYKLPPNYDRYAKLREDLLEDIRNSDIQVQSVPPASVGDGNMMLEMATVDHHFGSLAWKEETGQDYDLDIATDLFQESTLDLVEQAGHFDIEKILVVMGNDLMHFDNLEFTTTKGTPQDPDTRYVKVFRRARQMVEWQIRFLRQLAPVDVLVMPGNHDRLAAFHIGEIIDAVFDGDEYVTVDCEPRYRKYYEYGVVGLGFTHGDDIKIADLPRLMMDENPELVGRTKHREWHLGHYHARKQLSWLPVQTVGTTTVRILPSLCGVNAWHAAKGYLAPRGSECYLWHKTKGYRGHFSYTPEEVGYDDDK